MGLKHGYSLRWTLRDAKVQCLLSYEELFSVYFLQEAYSLTDPDRIESPFSAKPRKIQVFLPTTQSPAHYGSAQQLLNK